MPGEVAHIDDEGRLVSLAESTAKFLGKLVGIEAHERPWRPILRDALHGTPIGTKRPSRLPFPDCKRLSHRYVAKLWMKTGTQLVFN